MITQFEINAGANTNDVIKSRISHLKGLLDILYIKTEKITRVQTLTVDLIKAEISRIEGRLKK